MQILDFITDEQATIIALKKALWEYFTPKTLVINDTRGMIVSSVLPHIPFVWCYDQRILPILSHTSVVFSTPFSQEILAYYHTFWLAKEVEIFLTENNTSITLAKNISQNADLCNQIKQKGFQKIIPFFVNDDMQELSNILEIPLNVSKEVFEKANDKLLLKKYLMEAHLPTIDGDFTSDIEIMEKYFFSQERYIFKDPLWVSGYGFWDNQENTFQELSENYGGKELIIEAFIQKESSPSLQFFIPENKTQAIIFGITDQLLEDEKTYLGNTSPSIHNYTKIWDELIRQSSQIIAYIVDMWYTWFGWIDFIVTSLGEVFATEVNARFTWATYPAITSLLLKSNVSSKWIFYNSEWPTEDIENYLLKKSIQKKEDIWIFPLGISWIETFWKANLLKYK